MTRTARSNAPHAIQRDRSESKSGLDKSMRKDGGGAHNWGGIADEEVLEAAGLEDEGLPRIDSGLKPEDNEDSRNPPLNSNLSEQDMELAKKLRKNAFKDQNVDLAAIARSSAAIRSS